MSDHSIKSRNETDKKDQWDLTPLFKDIDEWEQLYKEIEQLIPNFEKFKGKLSNSFNDFYALIKMDEELSRKIEKLYTYAHLKNDEDKSNQDNLSLYERAFSLYTKISEASSYITPEIQSIPDDIMETYLTEEKIQPYKFMLEKIIRFKPHTLSKENEELLSMMGDIASAPSQIFSQLDNTDLQFGNITNDKGEEVELSHGNFNTMLSSNSRDVRKTAFHQYYKTYDNHKNTIATTLASSLKKNRFFAKARKFDSYIESALFSDNVPLSVYTNLINSVERNLPQLMKYLEFRKEALGVDELHIYDTYVPLVDSVDFHMSYEEAVDVCVKAVAPLGEDYCNTMRNGLLGGWVDRYENRGKRSGAYSSGCYDSPPYILLNYDEKNINSLYTLIHEAGHSMHSYYSAKHQDYTSHNYTIFVAEVASTFNETLLGDYLLKLYKDDPKMRCYILNREIDNIRGTLYRQTMFAEFEMIAHQTIENDEPLTLAKFNEIYQKLLEKYFRDKIVIDDELKLEALRIPHFYSAFYVYKYATGISAAISLAKGVLSGDQSKLTDYLNFLKLGGSMYPIDELKTAGVDMNTEKPIEDALAHFSDLVDELAIEFPKL